MAMDFHQEYVQCNLCGGSDTKLLFYAKNRNNKKGEVFRIVKCKICGLVYLNPRPSKDGIRQYYPLQYWSRIYSSVNIEDTTIWGIPWREAMRKKAKPILKYKKAGKLLDIGCGDGSLLKFLKDLDWEIYGVELGEEASRFARENLGLDVFGGRLGEANYPSRSFDVVSLFHSLEHLPDPLETLRKIYSLLKQDGIVVIEVPNFGGFGSLIFRARWVGIAAPLHLYHFTRLTLQKMLRKCSFVPIEFSFVSTRTKYIAEYSESLRYCLTDWGLYPFKKKGEQVEKDGGNSHGLAWNNPLHFIECIIFKSIAYFMDKIHLGSNLVVVARKKV